MQASTSCSSSRSRLGAQPLQAPHGLRRPRRAARRRRCEPRTSLASKRHPYSALSRRERACRRSHLAGGHRIYRIVSPEPPPRPPSLDAVPGELAVEGAAADTEAAGGGARVASVLPQGALETRALVGLEGERQLASRDAASARACGRFTCRSATRRRGPGARASADSIDVLQLPHVARPVRFDQQLERTVLDALHARAIPGLCLHRKWWTSRGMSSRRSRSGGISTRTTLRR